MSRKTEEFQEISPADFFWRNRDIAGFTNPARAMYTTIRELVENSLDATEGRGVLPSIYVRIREDEGFQEVVVQDNGCGVPAEKIPQAFGQVLFGSKYRLKQTRGTFGLGGKMAILYGQITTNKPVTVISSTGGSKIHEYALSIDIKSNKPRVRKHKVLPNSKRWHGTIIRLNTQGDYARVRSKIVEYLKQTAAVTPYADFTFVDPDGLFYHFRRSTKDLPPSPREVKPHLAGMDVEAINRIIAITKTSDLVTFMQRHFQRVGEKTARKFLQHAGLDPRRNPRKMTADEVVRFCSAVHTFKFMTPESSCLSPIGERLLKSGIEKEYNPEFVAVTQRKPSAYGGFAFIVETAIAYGGGLSNSDEPVLYRFANRIPLMFDEGSDVSRKVIDEKIDWRQYKVPPNSPAAVFVHICSTKIPYKTVGKEMIADRPEVEREVTIALREVGRQLMRFLTKREAGRARQARLQIFEQYLPRIARFATKLADKKTVPSIQPLLKALEKPSKAETPVPSL